MSGYCDQISSILPLIMHITWAIERTFITLVEESKFGFPFSKATGGAVPGNGRGVAQLKLILTNCRQEISVIPVHIGACGKKLPHPA